MTLDEVFNLVKQLPLVDKVRLIERVAPEIEQELGTLQVSPQRPPLFGSDQEMIFLSDDFDEPLEDFKDYT